MKNDQLDFLTDGIRLRFNIALYISITLYYLSSRGVIHLAWNEVAMPIFLAIVHVAISILLYVVLEVLRGLSDSVNGD